MELNDFDHIQKNEDGNFDDDLESELLDLF